MTIFISYSFEDRSHYENISDAFEDAGLDYWKTGETRAGEHLSRQLQDAISRSELCVFLATRNSVASSWCNAELGAFWGARKRVLIFMADDLLSEADLPRQFQGHFLQKRIKGLVKDCKQYLAELAVEREEAAVDHRLTVQGLTREDLQSLIEDAIARSSSNTLAASAFLELEGQNPPAAHAELGEDRQRQLQRALHSFIGLSRVSVDESAPQRWPHAISVDTSTGHWRGYAKSAEYQSYNFVHTPCIFFQYDERFRVVAVSLCRWYVLFDDDSEKVQGLLAGVGRAQIGEVVARESPAKSPGNGA